MRALFIFALSFFTVAALPYAAAQAPPASSAIAEIHGTGSSRYSDAQIAEASGLKPGDVVTRAQIQAAADHLSELGAFALVNYNFTSVGNKIVLTFELKDAPQVPVGFDNFPWLTSDDEIAAIRKVAPLYDGNVPTDGAELDQINAAITDLLKSRGLPDTVEHQLVAHPTRDGMMMQFRAVGPEITVDALDFGDALAKGSEQLRDRQQDLLHKPYSLLNIEIFQNEQILPIYLSSGHLRVQFGEPTVRFVGAPGQPSSKVSVALHIEPGPVYKVGIIEWQGVNALSGAALVNLMVLKTGDMADGLRLTAAWQRVAAAYAHVGYLDVKLDPQPQYDDAASTVAYHVVINEGPQYRMGDLVLTGLSMDAENRMRFFWTVQKNAVFDGTFFDNALTKLAKPTTEVFGNLPVHYTTVGHFLRINPDNHTVDVLLDFK